MSLVVSIVLENSIAERKHIEVGDEILEMNGNILKDFIDFIYYEANSKISMKIKKSDGTERDISFKKSEYDHIGIAFEGDGIGRYQACINRCKFCFIDQLPRGLRKSLYFKDDDWRLSFVMGNYVTLTNVPDEEFDRIIERKVSPLYISVHATDMEVRSCLLGQTRNGNLLPRLRRLAEAGIFFNCQVVLCKGLNDGKILDKTIEDLSEFIPYCQSVALIPVGLTKYREKLAKLELIDEEAAKDIIAIAGKWQRKLMKEKGTRFAFCADEIYIQAKREFPLYEEYEGFSQLEDGVGMVRLFLSELEDALEHYSYAKIKPYRASIATGEAAYPHIKFAAEKVSEAFGIEIKVYKIINHFFGETITVAGLLTAKDITEQLEGKDLGDALFITNTMLRDREDYFLDDVKLTELEERLNTTITASNPDGFSFVEAFLNYNNEGERYEY